MLYEAGIDSHLWLHRVNLFHRIGYSCPKAVCFPVVVRKFFLIVSRVELANHSWNVRITETTTSVSFECVIVNQQTQ